MDFVAYFQFGMEAGICGELFQVAKVGAAGHEGIDSCPHFKYSARVYATPYNGGTKNR
jgi:hypothetical protein